MGSHLWPFQKWFIAEPTVADQDLAWLLICECLDADEYEIGSSYFHDQLTLLVYRLRTHDWFGTPTPEDRALADAFIHECYAELLYTINQIEDQLASMIAGLRTGRTFLPRDHWLGGAFDTAGCATCDRSYAQLVKDGHDDNIPHEIRTTARERGSRPDSRPWVKRRPRDTVASLTEE